MNLVDKLATIRPDSTFLSIRGYISATSGEIANFQIAFHMSYKNALERSVIALEATIPENDIQSLAKTELLASYAKSLDKINNEPLEILGEHYDRVLDLEGNPIKGIKFHSETGNLHLFGLLVKKTVLVTGTHKPVNKRPLTIEKDILSKELPVSRFRQFIIKPGSYNEIRVENMMHLGTCL